MDTPSVSAPRVLTVLDTAERLCISEESVRRLVKAGRLPTVNLGLRRILIPASAVDRIVEAAAE